MKGESSSKQGKETSIFVLVTYHGVGYRGSLYEVKLDQRGLVMGGSEALLDPVAHFFEKSYDLPPYVTMDGACICNKLYLLISHVHDHDHDDDDELATSETSYSLNGFMFDLKTRALVKFKPPRADKGHGIVVYAHEKIYFLLNTACNPYEEKDSFERYDPVNDSWESLEPFPYSKDWARAWITGHAVYGGSILFSIRGEQEDAVMAYHENRNCWEPVNVEGSTQLSWRGRAVVLDKTIYASTCRIGGFIILSVRTDRTDEGHVSFTLGIQTVFSGLGMQFPLCHDSPSQCLTHLGDLRFCLVQSGFNYDDARDRQSLYITTFRIEEGNIIKVLDSTRRHMDTAGSFFRVASCFPVEFEEIGRNDDNTTPMNRLNLEEGTMGNHVGGTGRGSSDLNEPSTTQSRKVWSLWAMNKAKVTLYGFIPLVVIMGVKLCKPGPSQLLGRD